MAAHCSLTNHEAPLDGGEMILEKLAMKYFTLAMLG